MKLAPCVMTTKGLCVRCNEPRKMAIEKRYVNYGCTSFRHMQGNPGQTWILDSTPWIPDTWHWIPADSLSVELGFRILVVSAIRIPRTVFWIPNPRIPDSKRKISGIPHSTSKNFPESLTCCERVTSAFYRYILLVVWPQLTGYSCRVDACF